MPSTDPLRAPKHGDKAFMRWRRSELPSIGQMLSEQGGMAPSTESAEDMARRYAADL